MNPSKPVEWYPFKEGDQPGKSKDFAKISAVSVWNHRFIYQYHPNQAAETSYIPGTLQEREKPIYEVSREDSEISGIRSETDTREKTAMKNLMILQFYNFLVVKDI